ncbi:MAG: hypothetical protein P8Z70_13640, partial [Desulfuromonadales bacterium]
IPPTKSSLKVRPPDNLTGRFVKREKTRLTPLAKGTDVMGAGFALLEWEAGHSFEKSHLGLTGQR